MPLKTQSNNFKIVNLNACKNIETNCLDLIIGTFDVIHFGHKLLFDEVKKNKFNVLLILNAPNKDKYINTVVNRINNLVKFKPLCIYLYDVNENNLSVQDFIEKILFKINPQCIIVGKNFTFGKLAKGNFRNLIKYFDVKPICVDYYYHTSDIKKNISLGQMELVNQKLLFPIIYDLKICKGKQLGRKLGFPTLNSIIYDKKLVFVNNGVYATKCYYKNKWYKSATYVIHKDNQILIETYVINKKIPYDIYGNYYKLTFVKKVDNIHQAKNLSNLKTLIHGYKLKVKNYFSSLLNK